ncbi:MAG: hypothetical protein AB3N22_07660 [Ruegeria sp.]
MKRLITAVLAASALAGAAVVAEAKPLSRIIAEMGLSPADFELVNAASNSLFADGAPSAGQEAEWQNEATGAKGTVRVREMRDNCAHLQHFILPKGAEASNQVRTRRCRDASGNWVLTP